MKILIRFVIVLSLIPSTVFSQVLLEWERLYGGPGNFGRASAIAVDPQGNSHIAGWLKEGTLSNLVGVVKYNPAGVLQWVRTMSMGESGVNNQHIALDPQGNVIVVGLVPGASGYGFVLKYNASGAQQWIATKPGTLWKYCVTDSAGNIYVGGETSTTPTSGVDFIVAKYTATGSENWVRTYSGTGNYADGLQGIAVDRNGNVLVTGYSQRSSTTTDTDYLTIKYSPNGVQQWTRFYSGIAGVGTDVPRSMAIDGGGNIYVTGGSQSSGGHTDCATIKYSPDGAELWVYRYNGPGNSNDNGYKIAIDNQGNVLVAASTLSFATGEDIVTIKLSSSGTMLWNERYMGPTTTRDIPVALAVDRDNSVYVSGNSGTSVLEGVTVKYSSGGALQWVRRYSGPENYAWVADMGVDTSRNVFVAGSIITAGSPNPNNSFATLKYTQAPQFINITLPAFGEVVISNEPYDIRWNAGGLDSLRVEFSKDSGRTFTVLARNVPASAGRFAWMVPDTFSRKCIVRISNAADTMQRRESPLFKIKPYHLTRIDNEGDYEPYSPDAFGWQFNNSASNLWPQSWWSQFDYLNGIDPYTNTSYPEEFVASQPSDFPDWPLFVRTFGVEQCYQDVTTATYSPTAVNYWLASVQQWKGSCDGISLTSLMAFDYQQQFQTAFPEVGVFTYLYDLPVSDMRRRVINQIRNHFLGAEHLAYYDSNIKNTLRQTLQELKDILGSEFPSGRYLYISDSLLTKSHAVVPFRLERRAGPAGIYDLLIYDPNCPGGNCQGGYYQVVIDSAANRWQYLAQGWSGGRLFLMDAAGTYFNRPSLPGSETSASRNVPASVQLLTPGGAAIAITDSAGRTAGFSDSTAFSNIPGVTPIVPPTSRYQPPIGYTLPNERYAVRMHAFQDSSVMLSVFAGKQSFGYRRQDAAINQTDLLSFKNDIAVGSDDAALKRISLFAIARLTGSERMTQVLDCSIGLNDSLRLLPVDSNKVALANYGAQTSYTLKLSLSGSHAKGRFLSAGVTLQGNSTHIVTPNWDNLRNPVRIYIDIGNNGTIDDSISVSSIVDVHESNPSLVPRKFHLAQNFPNPFNPTTEIRYQISEADHVTLKVYDVLGREVAALVNEVQGPGLKSVTWNATGNASGVYYYTLRQGASQQTRTMLLIK